MGLYSGVGIVCQPLIGPWVDVIGRRPFMLVGIGLTVGAALLAATPGGVPLLAVVRALQGVGFSVFFVASFSYVLDIIPPAAARLGARHLRGLGLRVDRRGPARRRVDRPHRRLPRALRPLGARWRWCTVVLVWPVRGGAARRRRAGAPGARRRCGRRSTTSCTATCCVTMFFGLGSGTIFAFLPTFAEDLGVTTLSLFYTAYSLAAIGVRRRRRAADRHARPAGGRSCPRCSCRPLATGAAGPARRPGDAHERHARAAGAVRGRAPVGRRARLPLSRAWPRW